MKRVLTIQDLSCVGKCSLTVALPIISAAGVETAVFPVSLLSTHSAFESYEKVDLSHLLESYEKMWEKYDINFDAVYVGYVGTENGLMQVENCINRLKNENNIIIIDPAIADNGEIYSGISEEYIKELEKLCKKADVLMPNLTEACILTGEEYKDCGYSKEYIENIMKKLSTLGCKNVVVTGVSYDNNEMGIACYNSETKKYNEFFNKRYKGVYYGAGDSLASAFTGALMNGISFEDSLEIAEKFISEAVRLSKNNSRWYGINFEYAIPKYVEMIKEKSPQGFLVNNE